MQSDALAAVFEQYREEMATKHDLALLRAELKGDMNALRSDLKGDMSSLKADLTWRFVALTVFLGTVMTLVGVFVG